MKQIIVILLLFATINVWGQTTIGDGVLKPFVVGTEKIPVSGLGHPVISGNRLHSFHKLRFDSIYTNIFTPKFTLGSDAIGDIFQRKSDGFIGRLASVATGNVLLSGGVAALNSWGKVGLTTHVTGILPILNGGTGTTTPSLVAGTNISLSGTWPNQTVNATGGTYTASNGITLSGSDFQIGGAGVTNTQLTVAAGYFSISGNVGGSSASMNTYRNGGAGNTQLLLYNESASNVGTYFSMDHANQLGYGAGAIFTDTRASKRGIEYSATGFVTQTHSLADKEYVDAHNTVGGSNTQLQYNSSGVFGGISTATYNSATTRTTFTAGATNAALNIPPSSSPSVPTSGDLYGTSTPTLIWHDGANPRSIFMGSNTTTAGNIPYFSNTTNSIMTSEDALNYNASSNTLTVDHIAIGGTFSGQTTLVSGTKAITVTGATSSSRAFVQLVSPSGATLTVNYQAVCTTNTITIQANVAATTINTADGSTLNYIIYN